MANPRALNEKIQQGLARLAEVVQAPVRGEAEENSWDEDDFSDTITYSDIDDILDPQPMPAPVQKPDCQKLIAELQPERARILSYHEAGTDDYEDIESIFDHVAAMLEGIEGGVDALLQGDEVKGAKKSERLIREDIHALQRDHGAQDTPVLLKIIREVRTWREQLEGKGKERSGPGG